MCGHLLQQPVNTNQEVPVRTSLVHQICIKASVWSSFAAASQHQPRSTSKNVIGISSLKLYFIRSRKKEANKIQTLFISHLSVSDLLMGIILLILAISDMYYNELFPSFSHVWTESLVCEVTGFLLIISNEVSVFLVTLISIDRYFAIKYPFGEYRFTTTARVSVTLVWLISTLIGAIAIGLAGEKSNVFRMSEVCIGIPIIRPLKTDINYNSIQVNNTDFVTGISLRESSSDYAQFEVVKGACSEIFGKLIFCKLADMVTFPTKTSSMVKKLQICIRFGSNLRK